LRAGIRNFPRRHPDHPHLHPWLASIERRDGLLRPKKKDPRRLISRSQQPLAVHAETECDTSRPGSAASSCPHVDALRCNASVAICQGASRIK
jgi:hypothetical protein